MQAILIADDETIARRVIHAKLEKKGFTLLEASDGEDALRMIEGKKPDLILLDLVMPKFSGIEVLKKIRQNQIKTPVIVVTARALEENVRLAMKAGANDFIVKPINFKLMEKKIERLLGRLEQSGDTPMPDKEEKEGEA